VTRVVADAVAEGLMSRANANANAGRDGAEAEKPEASGQLATDEPLPEWERNLLVNGGQSAGAPVESPVAVPVESPVAVPVESSVGANGTTPEPTPAS